MVRIETQARELALQALYQYDVLEACSLNELRTFCRENASTEAADLAMELIEGCIEHKETLDDIIRRTAEHWELERMAISDRNILRLGTFELLFRPQTPPKVALNEAIELAKKYSTENSPTFVNGILDRVYTAHVKSPPSEDLQEPAQSAPAAHGAPATQTPDPQARADLHVHSTASDGSFAPAELPAMAAGAGLSGLALTDHDSVEGVAAARLAAEAVGIELVPGVELTSYARLAGRPETELHIAGLFVDCDNPDLTERLRGLRSARVERVKEITGKLREMGIEIESEQVLQRGPDAAVGRVHVAQEMIERGYCRDVAEVFGRYIGEGCPAYVLKEKMTPAEAIELVRTARGCAVLCHPSLTPGIEEYIEELVRDGLDALEVYCPAHTPRDKERLLAMARRFDLAVTGGSDFHGAAKPNIRIGHESVSFVELHELRRRAGLLV